MRPRRRTASVIAAVVAAFIFFGASRDVRAQTLHVVSRLSAFVAPDGSTVLGLFFENGVPQYRITGNGTSTVSLLLIDTAKQNGISGHVGAVGELHDADIVSNVATVEVRLHVATGTSIHVVSAFDGASMTVAITPAKPNADSASAARPADLSPTTQKREIVFLKYADVSELAGLISSVAVPSNDTFSPISSTFGYISSGFGVNGAAPISQGPQNSPFVPGAGGQSALGQIVTPQVAIDRRLNAAILSGTPAEIRAMRDLIALFDVPLASVLLETQILELNESSAADLGIDYSVNGAVGSVTAGTRSFSGPEISSSLQAAIYAKIAHGGGRVLATPRVLAESGRSASILTGDAIPVISNITYPGVSTPIVQQQIQYVNVGVNLQIQPRITDDGFVNTRIYAAVSSVTAYVQSIPQISQRVTTTSATVRDGEPFIIGGLLQQTEITNMQKVPLFGDLPLIGAFFRVSHRSTTSTNLYIMITPRIIRMHKPG